MNSVDGAPNATILAEGAPTRATARASETINTTTTTAAAVASAKTTERETTTTVTTSNVIKTTAAVADATDDRCHENEPKNVSACVFEEQLRQQPNEAPIMVTKEINSETVATPIESAAATKPINTMGNIKTTNNEKADYTADAAETSATTPVMQAATAPATAPASEPTPTANATTIQMKDAEANDVDMTDVATPEGRNGDNAGERIAYNTIVDTAATAAGTAVIDNKADDAKLQQPILTEAEGDNWKLNEMELCRCCGKPNVTLYDLFPNGNAGVSSNDEKANLKEDAENEEMNAIPYEKESNESAVKEGNSLLASVVDNAKNGARIKHKATTDAAPPSQSSADGSSAKDATKATDDKAKIDCETASTPKLCYRTIAASIAAAAAAATATASTTNASSSSTIIRRQGEPTCHKTTDPVVDAATTTTNGRGCGRRGDAADADPNAVEPGAVTRLAGTGASSTRVKKSATTDVVAATMTKKHAVAASNNNNNKSAELNNANAQGQNSDNMENILQEMQIWQLWIETSAS